MKWEDAELTTISSIAQHEKEINRQAGYKTRWSLYSDDDASIQIVDDRLEDYTDVIFVYSDGTKEQIPIAANTIEFPEGYFIKMSLCQGNNPILDFEFNSPKSGLTITSTDNSLQMTIEISDKDSGWKEVEVDLTWEDKIELAKTMLANAIETTLTERGYFVDEQSGEKIIRIITNPETFRIACDYLTLHLIYVDLSQGGFNELFKNKADLYWSKYQAEYNAAFRRINLDPALSGNTTIYRANITGYVSR